MVLEWYSPNSGAFDNVGWWNSANCLTVISEFATRTSNSSFNSEISNIYAKNNIEKLRGK